MISNALNLSLKGEDFNDAEGLADVSLSEKHFDCYNCIKSFCRLKKKRFEKFNFVLPIIARKSMQDS